MDQTRMPLCDALKEYISSGRTSLHVPGHKGGSPDLPELSWLLGDNALKCDITEIAGFDDLHEPEGILKEAQDLAADLYGSEECFFLVNGTTSGLMAAVAAAAGTDERMIISRDCHKSVARGLTISGASPIYLDPFIDKANGLPCGISPEELEGLLAFGGIKAIVLTNPSYYGTYSDLPSIVETAHRHGAAVIVDEAHGGHLGFAEQEGIPDAMSAGADISVQSTHKMNGSLTQSSMLHVRGDLIDRKKLAFFIRLMTSTSPSYLLMASLDASRYRMAADGRRIWHERISQVRSAGDRIDHIPGIRCIRTFTQAGGRTCRIDGARLLISAEDMGIRGSRLSDMLYKEYGIDCELSDERYILALAGPGTDQKDLYRLVDALKMISESRGVTGGQEGAVCGRRHDDGGGGHSEHACIEEGCYETEFLSIMSAAGISAGIRHEYSMTPREAVMAGHEEVELAYSEGRVSASDVCIYPPGIPLITAGEKISQEMIMILYDLDKKGVHIHGIYHEKKGGSERIMLTVTEDEVRAMLFDCIF